MITIVIADEQCLVRAGVIALLSGQKSLQVVGEASDGMTALELATKLKPDVVLTELSLPRMHGVEVIRHLHATKGTKCIVLTIQGDGPQVAEALRAGAFGYILKDDSPEELKEAIRQVAAGSHFISPRLKKTAVRAALGNHSLDTDPFTDLTQREREVLVFAAQGLSNSEIGQRLFISARTVESHRANLMKKLSLSSQTDLVRYAVRRKLISA